jgi:adsorption protein B
VFDGSLFEVVLGVLTFGFLLSGLDDLVVDVVYWAAVAAGRGRTSPVERRALDAAPQQKAAIITAAWHEEDVIDRMILYNSRVIDYDNYDVFVGTYPNDKATQAKVDAVARLLPHVFKAVTAHPGPTNKADNLNAVLAAVRDRERQTGETYAFIVMHDPEDVLHPLELKLVNHRMMRGDVHMLQTPIYPLPVSWRQFTGGTYQDEFAETHTKDMHVRGLIRGFTPSAGVATALRRDVLEDLARAGNGKTFSTNSLTEDYDLGLKLALTGHRAVFLRQRVTGVSGAAAHPMPGELRRGPVVATRAHFPATFRTSMRQRTRWTLGIVFQAWKNWGWAGSLPVRWLLFHDRKGPWSYALVAAGYALALVYGADLLLRRTIAPESPPLIHDHAWVRAGAALMIGLLANRLLQRAVATTRVYGIAQGLLSVLRQPWSNVINTAAMARAAYQFTRAELRGAQIAWDKTRHYVPDLAQAAPRLGDVLQNAGLATPQQIAEALNLQRTLTAPKAAPVLRLGEILVAQEVIQSADLALALERQAAITATRDPPRAQT